MSTKVPSRVWVGFDPKDGQPNGVTPSKEEADRWGRELGDVVVQYRRLVPKKVKKSVRRS